ncbi:hypothetical protein ACPTKM_18350, partial [Pseudomonas aeruginosa]|uniref:hypothetical protein n=1 Tax=Pseudomonas aeruginosa TaxID=287 RepID=UPI003CC6BE80
WSKACTVGQPNLASHYRRSKVFLRKPTINEGGGVINTGLGDGKALEIFNKNLIDFEVID